MDLRRFIYIVLGIFMLVVVMVLIFGRGSKPKVNPIVTKNLPDYADTNVQVQFTTDGIINGDDVHRQIIITIGKNSRNLVVHGGYEGKVIKSENLSNNESAYKAFLQALETSGFTRVKKSKANSEAGLCPLGQRFIYQVLNSGTSDLRTWSTSCSGQATFGGQIGTVQQLFALQFANYDDFVSDVNL